MKAISEPMKTNLGNGVTLAEETVLLSLLTIILDPKGCERDSKP
jgi:hypothetical protein